MLSTAQHYVYSFSIQNHGFAHRGYQLVND